MQAARKFLEVTGELGSSFSDVLAMQVCGKQQAMEKGLRGKV
jgi:hypothetical protein